MEKEIRETRIYRFKKEFAIECYDEIEDGKKFTNFYISDGTNKMFCVGFEIKDDENESDYVESILNDNLPGFLKELNYLDEMYCEDCF